MSSNSILPYIPFLHVEQRSFTKWLKVACSVSLFTLAGCSTGPYEPIKNLPPTTTATAPASQEKEKGKPAPETTVPSIDLTIGSRAPEESIDLSLDGPIIIPKDVLE